MEINNSGHRVMLFVNCLLNKFLDFLLATSINTLKKLYRGIFRFFLLCQLRMVKKQNYKEVSPDIQGSIVAEYLKGTRGHGRWALAKKYNLPHSTVRNILTRAQKNRGNPVRPRGHRKRKLAVAAQRKLLGTLDGKPWATNRNLAAAARHKIKPRTVTDYLKLAKPRFTPHTFVNQEPEELGEEWKTEMRRFIGKVQKIPLDKRIYGDEAAVYSNEVLQVGRARRGKKLFRPKPRWGKRYTLHVYARRKGVMYWELADKNADDKEVVRVVRSVAKKIKNDDVLLWDRLGRSGRKRNPDKQHYNPTAMAAIESKGGKVVHLPPKGKYLNPVELLFNDLKNQYIRPQFPENGENLSRRKLNSIIKTYMTKKAPTVLKNFFAHCANGHQLIKSNLLL